MLGALERLVAVGEPAGAHRLAEDPERLRRLGVRGCALLAPLRLWPLRLWPLRLWPLRLVPLRQRAVEQRALLARRVDELATRRRRLDQGLRRTQQGALVFPLEPLGFR